MKLSRKEFIAGSLCILGSSLIKRSEASVPLRACVGELKSHTATSSDDLFSIAKKYHVAVDHLAYANGFPITTIRVATGTQVIIPNWRILPANPPRSGIVINLPERGVFVFKNSQFHGFYPLSIGDEEAEKGRFATPTGEYSIIEKIKNPTWYPPSWAKEKKPVGPGPDNPLGDRWIGLSLPRTGIHGTNQQLNVGNSVTHGCLRTYTELLHELFDTCQVGWPARIEYETCKIGKAANGEIVFANFADVYKRTPTLPKLKQQLKALGLAEKVKRQNFDSVVDLNLGFPLGLERSETVYDEVAQRLHW
jgi:L,D-transpeptidase ErfK/SrfK